MMKFYIKQMNRHTVTLISEAGHVLAYFPSVVEALNACDEWYMVNHQATDHEVRVHSRDSNDDDYHNKQVA